ncbi:MAG: tRNA preQ1(34) S-adenosylmethionine ribosyltransferase-isomerase QueA [Myxococcota bacterium]
MTGDADLPELADYDFALPASSIAQAPAAEREDARLFVLRRGAATGVEHGASPAPEADARVRDLPALLAPGDLLVVNRTRVVPARLRGRKTSGGRAEVLLLGPEDGAPGDARAASGAADPTEDGAQGAERRFRALLRHRGRLREGVELALDDAHGARAPLPARVERVGADGEVVLAFPGDASPYAWGEPPLPPYIRRPRGAHPCDGARYQTVFADADGAVAAPTAGLHLTEALLERLAARGVEVASVVLHVGVGTFRPLRRDDLAAKRLHRERYVLPSGTAAAIARTRARGGRVVAVGTTTTRVLETCADAASPGHVCAREGETDLFLAPGDRFRVVDALLTNFHLPRSSLLLLVCAFAGRERVLDAYRRAVDAGYRFYSYGDAMLIL